MWILTYTDSLGINYAEEYETYHKALCAQGSLRGNYRDSSFITCVNDDANWNNKPMIPNDAVAYQYANSIFAIRIRMNDGTHYQVMTLFNTRAEAENYILNSPVNPSEDRIEIVEYAPIPF